MSEGPSYSFGPFRLDAAAGRLLRDGEPIALPERHADILRTLVANAGRVTTKDALISAAWKDVAVGDNSLEQAISSLRRMLGPAPDGSAYIETLARRGYRFRAPVTRMAVRASDDALAALLAPHRSFLEGRAQLETLERDAVASATLVFEEVLRTSPDYAPAHVGLANALMLRFESTRADEAPDVEAIRAAAEHARDACRLDASYSEAWATLALVLSRTGAAEHAIAAARHAIALEPDNWLHHVRLAAAAWGDERLRAAHKALHLLPGLGLAHWLAATVYVARQAFDAAEAELLAGAEAQDAQRDGTRFGAVGLHLLSGLVQLAQGDKNAAIEELRRELDGEQTRHVYTREASANSWCALGAIHLRDGDRSKALDAFDRALACVPGHLASLAVAGVLHEARVTRDATLERRLSALRSAGALVDVAVVDAIPAVLNGNPAVAARLVSGALAAAPAGSHGWIVPVDPLLAVSADRTVWAEALALLRTRAA